MTRTPTALVTGANRGLGQSIALALARSGHRVIAAHRPGSDVSETLTRIADAGGDALSITLDLSDVTRLRRAVVSLGDLLTQQWSSSHLDVLVNNAGIGVFGSVEAVTQEDFDAQIGTNLRGTFFLTQALLPLLDGDGHVINVSTSLTRHVSPATALYAASKAAVETLSRSLASELGPRGIRVNSIAPGPTATDFNGGAMRDSADMRSEIAVHTALGRVADPVEIGDAVSALASPQMRWVTGERLEVSGGAFL
ncbi:SDR family NAD(P)-dependent oxidoreductase [Microbacterium karelineae]|uniref:SDR family NAD(P)-dependent oxidoreductase n=1 Tax=Microbacterium karelineae TaxID=2654283 RepID=UPI0012EA3FAA|nr:SDR family oxidoreductase [Microbacterium karelineae]